MLYGYYIFRYRIVNTAAAVFCVGDAEKVTTYLLAGSDTTATY